MTMRGRRVFSIRRVTIAAALATSAAAMTIATVGTAHAADTLCNVNQNTPW